MELLNVSIVIFYKLPELYFFNPIYLLLFGGMCAHNYIFNKSPTTPVLSNLTPFERLYTHPPSYDHLRIFGCLCYATIVQHITQFESRANRCVFVGYPTGQKGYKLFDLATEKFFVSRDVKFHENIFPFQPNNPPLPNPSHPHFFPLNPPPPNQFLMSPLSPMTHQAHISLLLPSITYPIHKSLNLPPIKSHLQLSLHP